MSTNYVMQFYINNIFNVSLNIMVISNKVDNFNHNFTAQC